jgi:hypothetical protein
MRALLPFLTAATLCAQDSLDLTGVWSRGGGGAGRGAGKLATQWGVDNPPFTPAGLAQLNANKPGKGPRQIPPALGNDPMGEANPPGLYRTLIYNRPFEFVQTTGRVVQMFEWAKVWRTIWTDGRPAPEDIPEGPFWYGYSTGKWEGGELVVETVALDERAWLDEWGTPFAAGARVTERWRRVAEGRLTLTISMNDPLTYQKPWTSAPQTFTLQKKAELGEMIFAPMDEKEFNTRVRDAAAGVKK